MATVSVPIPAQCTVKVIGMTNSGEWGQQIIVKQPNGETATWHGSGAQNGAAVGNLNIAPQQHGATLQIQMQYNPGGGFTDSAIQVFPFGNALMGLQGYTVGGQDGGGRSHGPANWNTLALIYWTNAGY